MVSISSNSVQKIRILLVDDQRIIREGLRAWFEPEPDLQVVGTADNGRVALEQVEALQPDIILVDLEMPDLDGVSVTRAISERFSECKVVVLTSYEDDEYVSQALSAGAKGYLLKGTPPHEVKEAVRSIHRGYVQIGPGLFEKVLPMKTTATAASPSPQATVTQASSPSQSAAAMVSVKEPASPLATNQASQLPAPFEQAVVLRQSPVWARAIIWIILGVVTFGLGWSYLAKIEQVVGAAGQLKPQGDVKEVQSPVDGVVETVFVEDGEQVDRGEPILRFDSTTAQAQLESLNRIRKSLVEENQFYRQLMASPDAPLPSVEAEIARLDLSPDVALLTRNRAALVAENRLFRAQLGLSEQDRDMGPDELQRLRASRTEADTRYEAARLEVAQLEKQLNQNQVQLADAQTQLVTEQEILNELSPLLEEGAVARLQYVRQKQQVQSRESQVNQLQEEQERLRLDLEQAREELRNTEAVSQKTVLDQIADNKQQIAQIDSQLTKVILENEKRIAEIDSQLSQARQQLKYQDLKAPISGTVFDLQANPGFVANPSEMLLKIVPEDNLIAEVFITNQDIGFVREGMEVDVRIDSFPFSEFGDIKGEIISIGSDALPPDEIYDFYRFPAKIQLSEQALTVGNREIPLQSGMSVSANIKVRENRRVIDLFIERFTNEVETLKEVR